MCRIRPDSLLLSCWSPSTDTEEDMLRRFTMYSVDMAELPTYTPEEYNLYLKGIISYRYCGLSSTVHELICNHRRPMDQI